MPTLIELRQKAGAALDEWKKAQEERSNAAPEAREAATQKVDAAKTKYDNLMADVRSQEAIEAAEREDAGRFIREADRRGGRDQSTPEEKASKRFSLLRALNTVASKRSLDGVEREMFEEATREAQRSGVALSGDIRMPSFMLEKRDLTAGTEGQGGYTIADEMGQMVEILQPRLTVQDLGAQVMNGLVGDLVMPRQITKTSAVWEGENTAADETNITFDQLKLTPKRLAAFVEVSKGLMVQSSIGVENLVRSDLNRANRIAIDTALINGATGGNNPVGILNTTGIGSVAIGTDGGAPTWAHIVNLWREVAVDDADVNTLAYLTTPGVAAKLMQTEKASGTAQFIWMSNNREGQMNGYRAVTSTLVPSALTKGANSDCHAIIFGDFSSMVIGNWAGIDITVDPYTRAKEAIVVMTVNSYWDAIIRHPESFAAIKDARIV